ncbi:MAG: hypothetical protein HY074_15045 [Deltaproteobacteria bacterium]|nr:hypothetical protein [Deltaproteobacteria bacterium]
MMMRFSSLAMAGLALLLSAQPGFASGKCATYSIQIMPSEHDPVIDKDRIVLEYADDAWDTALDLAVPLHRLLPNHCNAFFRVGSLDELLSKIRGIRASCKGACITEMNLDSHGQPGVVSRIFADSDLLAHDRAGLADVRELFADNAVIRLLGCSIGKGDAGKAFLIDMGYYFLARNGGEVRAFTEPANDASIIPFPRYVSFNFSPTARYRQYANDGGGRFYLKKSVVSTL